MDLKHLLSYTRKAVDDYHMIEQNDRIAVGISGGKDSLSMLYALHGLKRFYPNSFEIEAITVDLGFGNLDLSAIGQLCDSLQVRYTVVETEISRIVFDVRGESNPCSLCAKMRKGAFNEKAKSLGCNKTAYAHHKDDIIETMLMSLIFEGRFHTFSPITYLDRMDLTLIRPLMYVSEREIVNFQHHMGLPVLKSPCPIDGYTKREYAKNMVQQLDQEHPGARERMFTAIVNSLYQL